MKKFILPIVFLTSLSSFGTEYIQDNSFVVDIPEGTKIKVTKSFKIPLRVKPEINTFGDHNCSGYVTTTGINIRPHEDGEPLPEIEKVERSCGDLLHLGDLSSPKCERPEDFTKAYLKISNSELLTDIVCRRDATIKDLKTAFPNFSFDLLQEPGRKL